MKFLVDAQLPAKLAAALVAAGHDTIHTSELPDGDRTTDARIADVADRDDRVVVTKDRDFRDGHLLSGSPRRLLVVATGNITNTELLTLFQDNLDPIVDSFGEADFVELGPHTLVIHQRRDPGPPGS